MCSVNKFCFVVPLDVGGILIGLCTSMLSLVVGLYCTLVLLMENKCAKEGALHLQRVMQLELVDSPLKFILSTIIIVVILWMFFSILLIVGIRKYRSNFVLCYFSYGIMMTILMTLNGLLLLLTHQNHWYMALGLFIAALIYVHCLVAVHSTYELMQRGVAFGQNKHLRLDDEENLVESTPV